MQFPVRNILLFFCAAAVLLVAAVITFNYVVFNDVEEVDGMYDVYRYFAPLTFLVDYFIHQGEIPLWNPLTYCGMPNSGNPQSFLFYLPNLIRSLLTVNPTPERSNISLAIMWGMHLLFMGLCTYLLGRAHRMSFPAALTAALAFCFSALMVRRMCEYHYVTSMAWMPLLLLLLKNMIDAEDFLTKLAIAIPSGLVLALSIMGGYLQIINLLGLTPALYALFYFLLNHPWKNRYLSLYDRLRPWLHNGIAMAVVFIVGGGLAAITLLPAWELGLHGIRAGAVSQGKFSDLWKWSPLDFYQKMVLYGGIKYEAETIRNAGIIALVLACAGLSHSRRRDVVMFAGMYLILLECCFGPPLPLGAFLEKITPFSISAYSRAYDFGLLPLCLLTGFGVDAMTQPMQPRGHAYARAILVFLFACVCIAPVAGWITGITYISINSVVRTLPMIGVAVMLFSSIISLNKVGRIIVGLLLAALLFSETLAWNQSYVIYLTKRKVTDVVPVKQESHELSLANARETDPICNRLMYSLRFAMNGLDPMHIHDVRSILSGPPREGPGLRGVQNWEPTRANLRGNMLFKRFFWLARQYAVGPLPGKREYYPTATTVFLNEKIEAPIPEVQRAQLPASAVSENELITEIPAPPRFLDPVGAGKKQVISFKAALPRQINPLPAGMAGAVHSSLLYFCQSSTNADIDITFKQPGTDRSEMGFRHSVRPGRDREMQFEVPLPDFPEFEAQMVIDNKGQGSIHFTRLLIKSDMNDEDGLIRIVNRTANTIDVQAGPLEEYRILTYLDADYPGWQAFVDGKETPIIRANEQFKAVILPPGTHRVYFAYRPPIVMQGAVITFSTLAAALVALVLCCLFRMRGVSSRNQDRFSMTVAYDPAGRPYTPIVQPENE